MTDEQAEIVRHSLGLSRSTEPYRNHFAASFGSDDYVRCERLVTSGHMRAGQDLGYGTMFHVTRKGYEDIGVEIPKDG